MGFNNKPGIGPRNSYDNSGIPQPRAAGMGVAAQCCDCGGSGNPPVFEPFCGVPDSCGGSPSFAPGGGGCCGKCGNGGGNGGGNGDGNGGGNGGCGSACDLSRGVGVGGSTPQLPSSSGFADDPLAYAYQASRNVHGYSLSRRPGANCSGSCGMPRVDLDGGNVLLRIQPPASGGMAPQATFFKSTVGNADPGYADSGNYGQGWNGSWGDFLGDIGGGCLFSTDCSGNANHWDSGSVAADAFNRQGSFIQPNGFANVLSDPSYLMQSRKRGSNQPTWTMTWDLGPSGNRVASDPFNRRMTFTYAYGDLDVLALQRIIDVGGRITTFTNEAVSMPGDFASYNRTGMTMPDNRRITMTYLNPDSIAAVTTVLRSLTTPDGQIRTYTYYDDGDARVRSTVSPLGLITTYTYYPLVVVPTLLPWRTQITDPRGAVTTFSTSPLFGGFTNPLGQDYMLYWRGPDDTTTHLNGANDALGRATFTYANSQVQPEIRLIQSIRNQASGIFTYVYDESDQIVGLINQKGDRTTLVWDSDGFRTAVINAKLLRTSYSYNDNGQITAVIDPLLRRTTYVYDGVGERSAAINPAGERTTYVYNAYGQVVATINPLGKRTTQVRDIMNRVTAKVDANGSRTTYVYDAMGRRVGTINPLNNRSTQVYDIDGRMIAVADANGSRTTYTYDGNANRTSMLDPLLRRTTYVYNPANQRVATINPLLQRTSYVYDAAGNQVATINPLLQRTTAVYDADRRRVGSINGLGQRSTIVYDGLGSQVATIDALGRRFTSVYDSLARQIATIDPLLDRTTFTYDNANRLIRQTNADLDITTLIYDLAGRQKATINPVGARTTSLYDAAGQRIATIDPLLNRNTSVYDNAGRPIASVDALGNRTTSTYDAAGQRTAVIDPLLKRTSFVYDRVGRPIATIDPLLNRVTSVYDAAGQLIATVDPLAKRTTFAYDAAGRRYRTTNALGAITTAIYDKDGRLLSAVNPLGYRTTFAYDPAGNQIRFVDALGKITTSVYDLASQNTGTIDPLGNRTTYLYDTLGRPFAVIDAELNRTTSVFDAAGRPVAQVDGNLHRTTMVYDAAGRRIGLVDANLHRTSFAYDANGQVILQTDALLRRTTFGYDTDGRLAKRVDPRGTITTYAYDGINRPTGRRYSDGTRVTMSYDSLGNRTAMQDPSGRYTYTYDTLSRLATARDWTDSRLTYTYDAVNQPKTLKSAAGLFTYTYDLAGQSIQFNDPQTVWAYDAAGQTTSKRNGNGIRTSYTYDTAGRTTRVVNLKSDGTTISVYQYKHDKVGNRTRMYQGGSIYTTYTYDTAYQLTKDQATGQTNGVQYAFDPAGNRSVMIFDNGTRTTYTYDAANQLTRTAEPTLSTLTYDPAGNPIIQRGQFGAGLYKTTMTWDAENRLSVLHQTDPGGFLLYNQRLTHTYNGDNLRVRRQTNYDSEGGDLRFVWDRQNMHLTRNAAGTLLHSYLYEMMPGGQYGNLICTGAPAYYLYDGLGSTRQLTDASQNVTDTYSYGPWGDASTPDKFNTAVEPFLFVGRQGYYIDDTIAHIMANDLLPYYVRGRFLQTLWGRWTNQDPLRFNANWLNAEMRNPSPAELAAALENLYAYVANNPLNAIDPSGLLPTSQWEMCRANYCSKKRRRCLTGGEIICRLRTNLRKGPEYYKCLDELDKKCDDEYKMCTKSITFD